MWGNEFLRFFSFVIPTIIFNRFGWSGDLFWKKKTVLRGHSLTTFTIFSSFLANYLCTPVDIYTNLYIMTIPKYLWIIWYCHYVIRGTSINDVPHFLAIFDLPTYLPTLSYSIMSHFGGYLGPTLIWDVINGHSLTQISFLVHTKFS